MMGNLLSNSLIRPQLRLEELIFILSIDRQIDIQLSLKSIFEDKASYQKDKNVEAIKQTESHQAYPYRG